jgi:hypothetical protein
MIRFAIALYAFGLLLYPVWLLLSPETYRGELLEEYSQAATATAAQLQTAAGLHWLKNAYLAFCFLLLTRYLGRTERVADVRRAGWLLVAFPVAQLIFQVLSQVAISTDPNELELKLRLNSDLLLYGMLGLSLVGIARTLTKTSTEDPES